MEIQYAIFCADVKFPDNPQGAIVLTKPVSNVIVSNISDVEFPLFVTFIDGLLGRHNLKVEVSNSSGMVIATRDFDFEWSKASISYADCFLIKFPIHSDILTFSIYLDGEKQQRIKLPIKIID